MNTMSLHGEWLSLIDISGPFLAEPVLKDAFPQGLDEVEAGKRKLLRQAYEEWRDAIELDEDDLSAIHEAWVDLVLRQGLELDEDGAGDVLKAGDELPEALAHRLPEHGITLRPDYAVVDDRKGDSALMLIAVYAHDVALDEPLKDDGWAASPAERMVELCRAADTRLGLVTNGERWMLVDAPVGAVTTFASWYANLWSQEPKTLQAFVNLLGVRRFFTGSDEQLPALLDESLKLQDEVTDALGEQVRRAVEVLIQALDRADLDRNRELLSGVEPTELYEAGLTVMMRIVFLLSAEERGLLLLGDETYETNYAISTLRLQLRAESEEILERRYDAWSRLLAIFRAVYGGIDHEEMRLPALGGSLFDPDRFPFLEGRLKDSHWRADPARPLPIDNRTVLLLLDAVQLFQGRTLSYRALDVEQIGYVYEGLLERTVVRAREVTLDLDATKSAKKPWVTLDELDEAAAKGADATAALLKERTGSSPSRVKNDLDLAVDAADADRLLTASQGDQGLRNRIKPYFHFLRTDRWGYPLVYPVGTFMVTTGTDRRETGTHYTPKSLTETIVKETLEPVVYVGPAEGKPREEWKLKSPEELLDLKICDPAMGSGAFLVQVCRWLAERLVEAWQDAEANGSSVTSEGIVVEKRNGHEPLRDDPEERVLTARRLIAERCLYGVDVNPLAVELAKLSIWLVTLAKGRPFGFLDHNLRSGDSLLGIHDLNQLLYLEIKPRKGSSKKLFASDIDKAIQEAMQLRTTLRSRPIRDIRDVAVMAEMNEGARSKSYLPELIADVLIGEALAAGGAQFDTTSLSIEAGMAIANDMDAVGILRRRAIQCLSLDLPAGKPVRRPLHWPLEFPEVFLRNNGGFDAFVGNPPFLGGRRMRSAFGGAYLSWLTKYWPHASLNADLCVFFYLVASELLRKTGNFGFLGTKTVAQGDTARTGLLFITEKLKFTIFSARSAFVWPGTASVIAAIVEARKGKWGGVVTLDGQRVQTISAVLDTEGAWGNLHTLEENTSVSYQGSVLVGKGFILNSEEKDFFLAQRDESGEIIKPYLSGDDINSNFDQRASRWAIDFRGRQLVECERRWPEILQRIRLLVKPQRDKVSRKAHREYWWQHGDKRPALYREIEGRDWVIVIARVTKYVSLIKVDANQVFHDKVYVLPLLRWDSFSILQSCFHDTWVRRGSSTVGQTLNYTPSDYLETFPFLHINSKILTQLGERYHQDRTGIMRSDEIGLTQFYNRIHDPDEQDPRIVEFRELQRILDSEVAKAYSWDDLSLGHSFHQVTYLPKNDNIRFSIAENARTEILRRLAQLNKERHEANKTQGKNTKRASDATKAKHGSPGDLFAAQGGNS